MFLKLKISVIDIQCNNAQHFIFQKRRTVDTKYAYVFDSTSIHKKCRGGSKCWMKLVASKLAGTRSIYTRPNHKNQVTQILVAGNSMQGVWY